MTWTRRTTLTAILALLVTSLPACSQTTNSLCDEIAKLNSDAHDYLSQRWQDEDLTPVDREILRLRAKAVPMLIGCLTDERKTLVLGAEWGEPSVAMVAFSMLWDLFTACDGYDENGYGVSCRLSIKGVITWDDLCKEGPSDVVLPCAAGWEQHLEKYGPRSIQRSWQKAWTENQVRMYFDRRGKCLRVKKTS
ncbi:MAG TPA: hypothetical protein VMO17_11645 [Terriglobia bacterium]|nr:hypothetical protein [Terriglobia bacterium]